MGQRLTNPLDKIAQFAHLIALLEGGREEKRRNRQRFMLSVQCTRKAFTQDGACLTSWESGGRCCNSNNLFTIYLCNELVINTKQL